MGEIPCKDCKYFSLCKDKEQYFDQFLCGRASCGDHLSVNMFFPPRRFPAEVYPLTNGEGYDNGNFKKRKEVFDRLDEAVKKCELGLSSTPSKEEGLQSLIADTVNDLLSSIERLLQLLGRSN